MKRNIETLKKCAKWLEYIYVIILLAALTQGPVFKIWQASSASSGNSIFLTYQMSFVIVQLPALLLLGRRIRWSWPQSAPVALVGAFCSWMVLSTFWATSGRDTIIEATTLAITAATGVYAARSFSHIQQIVLVGVAMQPGILFSYLAVKRNWEFAVSIEGNWNGIYFNRNSLAPVAAVGLLAAAGLLLVTALRRRNKWWTSIAIVLADIALLDGYVLYRTRSSTSIGALAVFIAVWMFWLVIRLFRNRGIMSSISIDRYCYIVFLAVLGLATFIVLRLQVPLLRLLGQEELFNGRTEIWNYGWSRFLERPMIGWGWMSAWHSLIFIQPDEWARFFDMRYSHNSYLDVLLGGGIEGGVLFVSAIVIGGYLQLKNALTDKAGQWSYPIMFFILALSTQEDFVIGNHFLWLLLVASICQVGTLGKGSDVNISSAPQGARA